MASYKKDVIFYTSIPPLVIEESWQKVCRGRTGPKLKQLKKHGSCVINKRDIKIIK
jgi:hypothetical protein